MAEIKWVKLSVDMFNNRKIRQIECLPDGYAVIVVWVKLMCLAGSINDCGQVYFTKEIPYTDQMMATQFNMPLTIVQFALRTFEQFGMVEIIDDVLRISNWEKYQNVDGMEKVREQGRIRQKKWYDKQKALPNVIPNVRLTQPNATDIDIDKDIDIDLKKEIYKEKKAASGEASNPPKKHKHGEYANVLLTDDDLAKLKTEFSDWQQRIERLSAYKASTGKVYKNDLATIRNWARRDGEGKTEKPKPSFDMGEIGKRFELGNIR